MKERHIEFEKLSDLHDGLIQTEEDKEAILEHLETCDECRDNYKAVKKTIDYLQDLERVEPELPEFASGVILKIKSRRAVKTLKSAMQIAAAAMVLIFAGILYNIDRGVVEPIPEISSAEDRTDDLLSIVKKSGARIIRDTDMFIEGEISHDEFKNFRKDIGFRRISYGYRTTSATSGQSSRVSGSIPGMTEVGVQDGLRVAGSAIEDAESKTVVRFRVYR